MRCFFLSAHEQKMSRTFREARISHDHEHGPIVVMPLTAERLSAMKAQAALSLNGDTTCSLHNMSVSCFAAEACAHGATSASMKLDQLMNHPHRWVACVERTDAFVGCVSAVDGHMDTHVARYFAHHTLPPTALVLYNLCVSSAFRGLGVGKALVRAVIELARDNCVYLLVARATSSQQDVVATFEVRTPKLLATYERMGFRTVCDCDTCYLLRRDLQG